MLEYIAVLIETSPYMVILFSSLFTRIKLDGYDKFLGYILLALTIIMIYISLKQYRTDYRLPVLRIIDYDQGYRVAAAA